MKKDILIEIITIYLLGNITVLINFIPTNYQITRILMAICFGIASGLRMVIAYIRIIRMIEEKGEN